MYTTEEAFRLPIHTVGFQYMPFSLREAFETHLNYCYYLIIFEILFALIMASEGKISHFMFPLAFSWSFKKKNIFLAFILSQPPFSFFYAVILPFALFLPIFSLNSVILSFSPFSSLFHSAILLFSLLLLLGHPPFFSFIFTRPSLLAASWQSPELPCHWFAPLESSERDGLQEQAGDIWSQFFFLILILAAQKGMVCNSELMISNFFLQFCIL